MVRYFVADVPANMKFVKQEEEVAAVEWLPLSEAAERIPFDFLKDTLKSLGKNKTVAAFYAK